MVGCGLAVVAYWKSSTVGRIINASTALDLAIVVFLLGVAGVANQ